MQSNLTQMPEAGVEVQKSKSLNREIGEDGEKRQETEVIEQRSVGARVASCPDATFKKEPRQVRKWLKQAWHQQTENLDEDTSHLPGYVGVWRLF